jgi:hypothetical protein
LLTYHLLGGAAASACGVAIMSAYGWRWVCVFGAGLGVAALLLASFDAICPVSPPTRVPAAASS